VRETVDCLCGAVIDGSLTVRVDCRLFLWCCYRWECDIEGNL
jgi:hypothetical protein